MVGSKQLATNTHTLNLIIQTQLGYKTLNSRSFLLNRVKKKALAPGNNSKGDARNAAAGPDIAKGTISKVKFVENGQGVLDMQNDSIFEGVDTREIKILVLVDEQMQIKGEKLDVLLVIL